MDLSFAKDLYFREFDDKAHLDNRLGLYVVLLSSIGGALAYLFRLSLTDDSWLHLLALGTCCMASIPYALAIIWVVKAMFDYTWEKLPSPEVLLTYRSQLVSYYKANPSVEGSDTSDFEGFLIKKLASAAETNSANNLARSARYNRASRFLVWVLILGAISGALLALDYARKLLC